MRERIKQVLRQAEFLDKLRDLLIEYEASIEITHDGGYESLQVNACGTWVPSYDFGYCLTHAGADIAAGDTRNFAKELA